jgi:hypothetical protein
VLIPVVDEVGLCDVLLLKEKAGDEVQGLAFRVLLHVNRNNLVNIHISYHLKKKKKKKNTMFVPCCTLR